MIGITLAYEGSLSDDHELDLYDLAQGIMGFQRSLALTTNLAINGEIITQAPKLKGARINVSPFENGSFKIPAWVVLSSTAMFTLGTAERDTPVGHVIHSMYDYLVSEIAGFHVDYDKSLGIQFEELQEQGLLKQPPTPEQMDSLTEKCEVAIRDIHRPIVGSESASSATFLFGFGDMERPSESILTRESFEYIDNTERGREPISVVGKISSYNVNTFKGRIFSISERRPIPFELANSCQRNMDVRKVTTSLRSNAINRNNLSADIEFVAFESRSQSGRLKGYYVVEVLSFENQQND